MERTALAGASRGWERRCDDFQARQPLSGLRAALQRISSSGDSSGQGSAERRQSRIGQPPTHRPAANDRNVESGGLCWTGEMDNCNGPMRLSGRDIDAALAVPCRQSTITDPVVLRLQESNRCAVVASHRVDSELVVGRDLPGPPDSLLKPLLPKLPMRRVTLDAENTGIYLRQESLPHRRERTKAQGGVFQRPAP